MYWNVKGENLKFYLEDLPDQEIVIPECRGVIEVGNTLINDREFCRDEIDIRLTAPRGIVNAPYRIRRGRNKKWVHITVHEYGGNAVIFETDVKTDLPKDMFIGLYKALRTELKLTKGLSHVLLAKDTLNLMAERKYIEVGNNKPEIYHIKD